MTDDLESLANQVSDLTVALMDRDAVIAELRVTVAIQAARITGLEHRLWHGSSNSGKRPETGSTAI